MLWLKPFGLPLELTLDEDSAFLGEFQDRMLRLGVVLQGKVGVGSTTPGEITTYFNK